MDFFYNLKDKKQFKFNKKQFKQKVKKFFFPFSPLSVFQTVQLLTILGIMLGISLVLKRYSIPIPAFRTTISFGWLPLMVVGWFFGPVTGFVFGWITDTIGFLLGGGVWFWLYAIQEPIIGMFAGFVGSFLRFIKVDFKTKKLWPHILVHQFFLLSFLTVTVYFIVSWVGAANNFKISWFSKSFLGISIGFVGVYSLIIEIALIFMIKKKYENLIVYLYASIIVYSVIFLWSFILGPKSAILYFQYINGGRVPGAILRYGTIYYLIPRIIRESIKTPIQAFLLTSLIMTLTPVFNNVIVLVKNSYHYKKERKLKSIFKIKLSNRT